MKNNQDLLRQVYYSSLKITVYRNILQDQAFKTFMKLVHQLNCPSPLYEELIENYHTLSALLMNRYGMDKNITGDLWQNHVINLVIEDENIFSLMCEAGQFDNIPPSIVDTVLNDLTYIQQLFNVGGQAVQALKEKTCIEIWPSWEMGGTVSNSSSIKDRLLASNNRQELLAELSRYYRYKGCGLFSKCNAFRWVKKNGCGCLVGVSSPDPIRLEGLIGYEAERSDVLQNTLQFIHHLPANNVLLYGDRGTGKSSTVKALLNEYAPKGLRLIELSKHHLADLPEILALLQNRGLRFIIFVDDLAFESDGTQYTALKSILEGGVEAKPSNVLIYATSNRRHLIKEYFSERSHDDEVSSQDTMQEKLSLADRFGITITFTSPDQEKYLRIVEGLAKQRKLNIDTNQLRQKALKWEMWHNGRSPRTAKQFINHLEGQRKLVDSGQ